MLFARDPNISLSIFGSIETIKILFQKSNLLNLLNVENLMNILIIGGLYNIEIPMTEMLADMGHKVFFLGVKNINRTRNSVKYIPINDICEKSLCDLQSKYLFDVVVSFDVNTSEQAREKISAFSGKIKQFIFFSTHCVLNREKNVFITEETGYGNPFSIYAQEKQKCEEIFMEAHKNHGFPITIIRPTQVYSRDRIPLSLKGRNSWSVIERIVHGKPVIVHGDGTSTLMPIHSYDLCRAVVPLFNNNVSIGQIYNLAGDEILTWNMIYDEISTQLNKKVNIVHIPTDLLARSKMYDLNQSLRGDKQYSVVFDNAKIKSINSDFKCLFTIRDGIRVYLNFMNMNTNLKISDPTFDRWCDDVIGLDFIY